LLVGLFALAPGIANAQEGWWEWLEKLSGPGPYHGYGVELRAFCVQPDGTLLPCLSDHSPEIRHLVLLRVSHLWSGDKPRFSDTPTDRGQVNVTRVEPEYMYRMHPSLDLGVGVGFMRFSGSGFDPIYRLTLTPQASFVPFALTQSSATRRWARVLRLRFSATYVTKGFKGADFGNLTTDFFKSGEFLWNGAGRGFPILIAFDFGEVFRRR
jgi:hypothetical protein